jgi:hypothetical protein
MEEWRGWGAKGGVLLSEEAVVDPVVFGPDHLEP